MFQDAGLRTVAEIESHSFPVSFKTKIIRFQTLLKMELVLKRRWFLVLNLFICALKGDYILM